MGVQRLGAGRSFSKSRGRRRPSDGSLIPSSPAPRGPGRSGSRLCPQDQETSVAPAPGAAGLSGEPSRLFLFLRVLADQVNQLKPVPDTELLVDVVDAIPDRARGRESVSVPDLVQVGVFDINLRPAL